MEVFASAQSADRLSEALAGLGGALRATATVELAWHLRQRDTARAISLAQEAGRLLGELPAAQRAVPSARLLLVRAECALLDGRPDEALALAAQGEREFRALADAEGLGDAAWLRARIHEASGNREQELAGYKEAIETYAAAGLTNRAGHVRAAALMASGFADSAAVTAEVAAIRLDCGPVDAALETHLRFVEGVAAFQRGAFLDAVPVFDAVAAAAAAEGMIEQSLRAELGLASALSNLGDKEACCANCEKALARARTLGWPRAIAHALANFGRQLADAGQPERGVELLGEALARLQGQPRSRAFAIATYYLGDACLAMGDLAQALREIELAERLMTDLGSQPEIACLRAIAAQALCRLGRPEEALAKASSGLELARRTKSLLWEVEALRSLAEIHATHRVAGEDGTHDPRASLRFLEEAVAVVERIGGHHEKSQLLAEVARAHEAAGDLARALAAERAARDEQIKEEHRRARNILLLAQVRYESERQRLEVEHHRRLAEAEGERAAALETALGTLEQLRRIGQDITTHLAIPDMLRALERHLNPLAQATFIGVYLLDAAGARLRRHAIERGRLLPERDIPLADPESHAARVAREGIELYLDRDEAGLRGPRVPGTEATRSLWYGPLAVEDALLGVFTVQASTVRAYGEREKLVFRTVSGYAAVALANARTHGELAEKHRQLARTEAEMRRLATLDPLTGLANRRRFMEAARAEMERARRYGGAVGLIMADLDRFKTVNDTIGHGAGDVLIAAVAKVLAAQQRPNDIVGRVGGEEFALVLPAADLAATASVAGRIRAAVEALRIDWEGRSMRATMSLGCACLAGPADGAGDPAAELGRLMRVADAALYEAKAAGRNRVVTAGPGAVID